jgi:hypothetical protein
MKKLLIALLACLPSLALAQTAVAPVFAPAGGTGSTPVNYTSGQNVTMTSSTTGAVIHWGYSGSPTSCTVSSTYSSAVYVNPAPGVTDTLCAYTTASGYTQSPTTTETYTVGSAVATGDSRTVTEPTFLAICSKVAATKYIVSTTALNVDPYNSTCGSVSGTNGTLGCTGGTSLEPSSTASPTYTSAETNDNTAVQNALNACASGQAVELTAGSSGQMSVVLAPWTLPTGVKLVIDPGFTVYASRNPSDFGGGTCGTISGTSASTSCGTHWITAQSTSGSGVLGYGVLDARGWDKFYGNSAASGFYYNRVQTYCNNHGGAINGSPACTPVSGATGIAYGPDMFHLKAASNFTLYKVTLKDSDNFNLYWGDGSNGLTAWGIKIASPFEVSNTDGIDPSYNSSNFTIANSFISVGDNHVAMKSDCGSSCSGYSAGTLANGSFLNNQTGAGIGVTIGADTSGGVSNILVNGLVQKGNHNNTQSTGFGINTSGAQGGALSAITYENVCMTNETSSLLLSAFYASGSSHVPTFANIFLKNIHVLNGSVTGNSGSFVFKGYNTSNKMGLTLDNVVSDGTITGSTSNENATVSLGPDPVSSNVQATLTPSSITVTNNIANSNAPYACTTSTWQPLIGDLVLKTATANNLQSYSQSTYPAAYTLQAIIRPTTTVSSKEAAAIAQPITFYDNGSSIGGGSLSANGTLATLALSGVGSGTHVYTASYPGDSNYSSYTFGNLVATIGAGSTVATPVISPVTGTYAPGQVVTITDSTAGATIYYTTDGSTPTTSSTVYTSSFAVSATATVNAIAAASGYANSAVTTQVYTISSATLPPTFSPPAAVYPGAQTVTITDGTSGATIYYTLDGSTPTTASAVYSSAISVPISLTLKAFAVKSGLANSSVTTGSYTITLPITITIGGHVVYGGQVIP